MTNKQRAHLRKLSHALDPALHVGKEGVTEAVIAAVTEAFNTRELLKIRVLDNAPRGVRGAAERIAAAVDDAEIVQTVGHVAVLFRPHPEKPVIELPKK